MSKEIIEFNIKKLSVSALVKFFRITSNKEKIIGKEEIKARTYVESNILISAIYTKVDCTKSSKDELIIENDVKLKGKYFETIETDKCEIMLYIIVVNNINEEKNTNILDKYYIDAWKLAYLEAAEEELNNLSGTEKYLAVGPGHENFPIENLKVLFTYLEGNRINASLNEKDVMIPDKSIIKLVIVDNTINKTGKNCGDCKTRKTCEYCTNY